jgi:hypothetical protein
MKTLKRIGVEHSWKRSLKTFRKKQAPNTSLALTDKCYHARKENTVTTQRSPVWRQWNTLKGSKHRKGLPVTGKPCTSHKQIIAKGCRSRESLVQAISQQATYQLRTRVNWAHDVHKGGANKLEGGAKGASKRSPKIISLTRLVARTKAETKVPIKQCKSYPSQ